jgi:hypothetical protein
MVKPLGNLEYDSARVLAEGDELRQDSGRFDVNGCSTGGLWRRDRPAPQRGPGADDNARGNERRAGGHGFAFRMRSAMARHAIGASVENVIGPSARPSRRQIADLGRHRDDAVGRSLEAVTNRSPVARLGRVHRRVEREHQSTQSRIVPSTHRAPTCTLHPPMMLP